MVQLEVALDEEVNALERRGCEAKREEVLPEPDDALSVVRRELLRDAERGRGDNRARNIATQLARESEFRIREEEGEGGVRGYKWGGG